MKHAMLINALVAFVPLLVGFVWYNPRVFGKAWMSATGLTQDSMKNANMPVVFITTYILGFFLAFVLMNLVVHQHALNSILMNEPGFKDKTGPAYDMYHSFMMRYQHNFRTLKHGAFHGLLFGILAVLPIIAINGLFEGKGWKYILINAGYWTTCTVIMGALICHFSPIPYV